LFQIGKKKLCFGERTYAAVGIGNKKDKSEKPRRTVWDASERFSMPFRPKLCVTSGKGRHCRDENKREANGSKTNHLRVTFWSLSITLGNRKRKEGAKTRRLVKKAASRGRAAVEGKPRETGKRQK